MNRNELLRILSKLMTLGLLLFLLWLFDLAKEDRAPTVNSGEIVPENIVYTKHAICRMDCRKISKQDILETINSGRVNFSKSDPQAKPCPVKAYEKQLNKKDKIRVIVASCESQNKIVTAIKLGQEFDCSCS